MYAAGKGGYRKKKSLHTGGASRRRRSVKSSHTGASRFSDDNDKPVRQDGGNANARSELEESRKEFRLQRQAEARAFDEAFGFSTFAEPGQEKEGWLLNLLPTTVIRDGENEEAAVDVYFLQQDGGTFRVTILHQPHFYIRVEDHFLKDVVGMLERRFEGQFSRIDKVEKVDLEFPNHLVGLNPTYLKLSFPNVQNLMNVRKTILPAVEKNRENSKTQNVYANFAENGQSGNDLKVPDNIWECVYDIREYDVPYYVRAAIDLDLRAGAWYDVKCANDGAVTAHKKDMLVKAEPRVLAFDIECTKAPLKFPNADTDQVFMISYMFDGQGYLIINREVVSEDIDDFEYTPKPQYHGPFIVFNEENEKDLLVRFFEHCQELRPNIWVTYNGDFFDWPFIEKRALKYNIIMDKEIGVSVTRSGEYRGRCSVHMDAFSWVQRDSYLPQGSRGLKAVTKYKLGYDPVEVAPEDMVRFASEQPQRMASYSVSDAVATYYLYMKYVHNFIFSLCTIIPMIPEDVLRKGSGTLCEMLLMVEAFDKNIIAPNKQKSERTKFYKRQLLESETYVGGHVESLLAGVYRDDLPESFDLDPAAFDELIANIDRDLTFVLEVEEGKQRSDVNNYDEVRNKIIETLEAIRDNPRRREQPTIYHLDVAAMYPNIILTNRLQPTAIVSDSICATCDFNRDENKCKRKMKWTWRGDLYPSTRSEYNSIKNQVEHEMSAGISKIDLSGIDANGRKLSELEKEKDRLKKLDVAVRKRLKGYCQTVYKKVKNTIEEERYDTVCQRENPFYVDTVRAFRDRRYVYKKLTKKWSKEIGKQERAGDQIALAEAKNKAVLFDSLQLAHKCILNSFYGYVMRRGARWYSMPMAGIVTKTGADLIKQARELVERIGRPLELDTDGIWCILPSSFPENYKFEFRDGSSLNISYPCVMLNADVHQNYTNDQYQTLVDPALKKYEKRDECSIFFEVDGPYRCMVLPASQEKGKLLKKRYAVFNNDGSLAELKGFEIKRRGELQLIKLFQGQVFEQFLQGETIQECYEAVAKVGTQWLNILWTHAEDMEDDELIDLISENKNMSKGIEEYGDRKSTAITVARRLAQFLGKEMIQGTGVNCRMIISRFPVGAPTSERAIPTAIFNAEPDIRKKYLRKWSKKNDVKLSVRDVVDWQYYLTRLSNNIQKIITIPAGLQNIANPIPKIPHPDWLLKMDKDRDDPFKQRKISAMFAGVPVKDVFDMEDFGKEAGSAGGGKKLTATVKRFGKNDSEEPMNTEEKPFDAWLSQRKAVWKAKRQERKRLRSGRPELRKETTGSNTKHTESSLKGGVAAYFRGQTRAVMEHHWQIIEIRETPSPGIFHVFALTAPGTMQRVVLKVPRVIYINSRVEKDATEIDSRLVKRYLPHGKKGMFVYEITMSESAYQRNSKELSNFLTHPDFDGVYEKETPLMLRSLCQLGCVARVSSSAAIARRRAKAGSDERERPYELHEMEFLTTASHEYLHPDSKDFNLRRIYVYHSQTKTKGIVGVFVVGERVGEEGSNNYLAECSVWIVDVEGGQGDPYNTASMIRPWKRYSSSNDKCAFQKNPAASPDHALKLANEFIEKHRASVPGPAVIITESPFDLNHITSNMPVLADNPVVLIRGNEKDNTYPAIQWEQYALNFMVQRYLMSHAYYNDRLSCAQYSHIPIGNMSDDCACDMADVFMGRMLRANKHLFWSSKSSLPDVGTEEGNLIAIQDILDVESKCIVSDPGSYRTICVEVDLFNLAVNTVIEAPTLADMEGGEALGDVELGFDNSEGGDDSAGDSRSTAVTFRILRNLVNTWFREVKMYDNAFADLLLMHFYRWLCSSKNLMFDPALHRTVQKMMNKVFMNLVAEFRNLGSKIIYASFNKLIIATNKTTLDAAKEYVNFIIDTVQARQLFSRVHLQPKKYWSSFLYNDNHNYGGILLHEEGAEEVAKAQDTASSEASIPGEEIQTEVNANGDLAGFIVDDDEVEMDESYDENRNPDHAEIDGSASQSRRKRKKKESNGPRDRLEELEESLNQTLAQRMEAEEGNVVPQKAHAPDMSGLENLSILSHWNLVDYLPEKVQEPFEVVIGEFILKPWKWRVAEEERRRKLAEQGEDTGSVVLTQEECDDYVKTLVRDYLTKRLYKIVPHIHRHLSTEEFPLLPGSHLQMTNPALEFVKAITQILSLETCIRSEVQLLKRNLLKIIGVREFDASAIFHDPCRSYVLKDIICSYCNYSQDLDLARDPSLVTEDEENAWRCPSCDNKYDKHAIEYALVELVHQRAVAYQTQDLRCPKSKKVQLVTTSNYCEETSKPWQCDYPENSLREHFSTFHRISVYHSMEYLQETVERLLQV